MAKKSKKKLTKKTSKRSHKKKTLADHAKAGGTFAEWVPINSIKPWKDNPRENEEAVTALVETMTAFGWSGDAITVDQWGTIRAGDSRYKAAKILKLTKVPVRRLRFRDKQHAEMFALAHNKIGERASWNVEKLAEIFERTKRVMDTDEIERLSSFRPREIKWAPTLVIGGEDESSGETTRVHLFVKTESLFKVKQCLKRLGSAYDLQSTTDIVLEALKREHDRARREHEVSTMVKKKKKLSKKKATRK